MFAGKLAVPKCWLFVAFNPLSAQNISIILLLSAQSSKAFEMQQIANILEQPISLQTSPRKTRKRPYSLVLFIPAGAGAAPACTHTKIN